MKAWHRTEAELNELLVRFLRAYEKGSVDDLMDLMVNDEALLVIGTEADERCEGPDAVRALFEQDMASSQGLTLESTWSSTCAAGPVGWVAADLVAHSIEDGEEMVMPLRLTMVAVLVLQRWYIAQLHLSLVLGESAESAEE